MKTVSERLSGICGILVPLVALIFIGYCIAIHPWFSFPDNALSDLGAVGTSYNFVYNLGMITTGVIGLIFIAGIGGLVGRVGLIGAAIFSLGLVSLILVGVFPGGTGPHVSVSIAFFALCALGTFVIGVDQICDRSNRAWGVFLIGIVALGLVSVMLCGTIPHLGAAIPETIGAFAFSEFSIAFGARLLGMDRKRSAL